MSCQINLRLANAWNRDQKGYYKKPEHYYGDHFHYLFCTVEFLSLLVWAWVSYVTAGHKDGGQQGLFQGK